MSPHYLRDVVGVARTFPIRVGTVVKTSGPMFEEVDWDTVTRESGSSVPLSEKTTVTQRVRRVGRWDDVLFRKSIAMNSVNLVALTFVNYISAIDKGCSDFSALTEASQEFVRKVNKSAKFAGEMYGFDSKVGWFSTDEHTMHPINL